MLWNENVLKIFLKTQGLASYSKKFSQGSKDMTFVSDLSVFVSVNIGTFFQLLIFKNV